MVDYPDVTFEVAEAISKGKIERSILTCGCTNYWVEVRKKVVGAYLNSDWAEDTARKVIKILLKKKN